VGGATLPHRVKGGAQRRRSEPLTRSVFSTLCLAVQSDFGGLHRMGSSVWLFGLAPSCSTGRAGAGRAGGQLLAPTFQRGA